MSPEQAEGRLEQVGPLSDVYSLGATLYCLLTGKTADRRDRRRRGAAPGAAGRVPAAAGRAAGHPTGPGGDLPEGDGLEAGGALPLGRARWPTRSSTGWPTSRSRSIASRSRSG